MQAKIDPHSLTQSARGQKRMEIILLSSYLKPRHTLRLRRVRVSLVVSCLLRLRTSSARMDLVSLSCLEIAVKIARDISLNNQAGDAWPHFNESSARSRSRKVKKNAMPPTKAKTAMTFGGSISELHTYVSWKSGNSLRNLLRKDASVV